jgi:dTMP kinase
MGKLIVFEGIDGAGKATQVEFLAARMKKAGKKVSVFTSPRYGTVTGDIVKSALHGAYGDFVALSPYLSGLPYVVDFAAMKDEILRALKKGDVICDRYVSSTLAYHSAKLSGAAAEEYVATIEDIAFKKLGLPMPNRVIYLHVPVEVARRLMEHKKKDQHERNASYQARVAHAYAKLATRKNWRTVECVKDGRMRPIDDIHKEIARLTR